MVYSGLFCFPGDCQFPADVVPFFHMWHCHRKGERKHGATHRASRPGISRQARARPGGGGAFGPGQHRALHRPLPQGAPRRHGRPGHPGAGGPPGLPAGPGAAPGRGAGGHPGAGQAHPGAGRRLGARRHLGGGGGPLPALPAQAPHPRRGGPGKGVGALGPAAPGGEGRPGPPPAAKPPGAGRPLCQPGEGCGNPGGGPPGRLRHFGRGLLR